MESARNKYRVDLSLDDYSGGIGANKWSFGSRRGVSFYVRTKKCLRMVRIGDFKYDQRFNIGYKIPERNCDGQKPGDNIVLCTCLDCF